MSIKCVIIDDEPLALKVLETHVNATPFLELSAQFTNALEAISYINQNQVDLIFIDIQMPDINGLEVIKKLERKPMVIFTTAYSDYAMEGFKSDAIDYLLKPIDFDDFSKAVNKAKVLHSANSVNINTNKSFLFIKSEYKIIRINLDDILYIQGMSEYVKIHLQKANPIMSLISLKSLEAQLPENKFMRVHKSYIVNLEKIVMIERGEIIYDNGTVIPVSSQYKDKFQNFIDNNFII